MQLFHTTDYDMSNETVKECLSHQYVMKLHRHTSHENDEMTTNKWPQFMTHDVEHDNIYVLNEFIFICCRNTLRQKKSKMPDQVCANGYMTSHRIYRTYCHWREELFLQESHSWQYMSWDDMVALQSKWSTRQCSSNTRSNCRNIALHALWVATTSYETKT